jgi:hypothetical protein
MKCSSFLQKSSPLSQGKSMTIAERDEDVAELARLLLRQAAGGSE